MVYRESHKDSKDWWFWKPLGRNQSWPGDNGRPDEVTAFVIANSSHELLEFLADEEFVLEFEKTPLIKRAIKKYGKLEDGFCFGFVIPPVLGGEYSVKNISLFPLEEYLGITGDIGRQIQDLPDGSPIKLKIE